MINQACLRGKTYEGEVVDLSQYMRVCDCYFKDCDIIIKNEEGRSYIRSGGFNNVVFDNCRIKPGKIGVQKLSRDNPTLFKNTKIDIISSDLKNNFFRAFLSEEISNDWKYYMSKYWSGCTINGEPIKEFNSSEYKDGFDFLDEKLPKFSKEDEKLIKISIEDEIDKYEKQLSILKAIEETSGVDMGFQKGMLDVEFSKLIIAKNPNDENYSSYDAGIEYALRKRYNMISKFTNVQDDNKFPKK